MTHSRTCSRLGAHLVLSPFTGYRILLLLYRVTLTLYHHQKYRIQLYASSTACKMQVFHYNLGSAPQNRCAQSTTSTSVSDI